RLIGHAHQARPRGQRLVVVRMLQSVAELVRGHRHGGEGTAVQVGFRQTYGTLGRVVVIARLRELEPQRLERGLLAQMFDQLAAGAGDVGAMDTVLLENVGGPLLGAEDEGREEKDENQVDHGKALYPPTFAAPLRGMAARVTRPDACLMSLNSLASF